ncbi:MAG: ribonuclease J [Clostridia bacterium]|nr:ribonuclease J [Clostridia bacterium]
MKKNNNLKVRFLGGVGEIGKNMTAIEYGKDIIVIDAGLTFPSQDMPGVDIVIPDIGYLVANKERVRGIFLTHGHEDHIGCIPYLIKDLPSVPIYGTKMTLALLEVKFAEFKITNAKLKCVKEGDRINAGVFNVEFIHVNHSISGACALAITTPIGVIVHSGDFKIDLTPINTEIINLSRLSEIGKKGVLLLLCESTNVERKGYTLSETQVGSTFERLFAEHAKRRLIIATFSSNVYRLQQILTVAGKFKRKVALSGRSMLKVAESATKVGELIVPNDTLIDIDKIKNYAPKDVVIVCTGSQGEPMSALTRMTADDYPQVKITQNDTVIISASPIPGNEKSIYQVINNLYKKGAQVVYESIENVHVSGHACQEELKIIHSILNPRYFIPVHGEYRHLKKHAILATQMGMKESRILIPEIGDTAIVTQKNIKLGEKIQAGSRYVDGLNIDNDDATIRDRVHLGEDGLIIVLCYLSSESGKSVQRPDLIVRGIGLNDKQTDEIKDILVKTLTSYNYKDFGEQSEFKKKIRASVRNYVIKKTKNNPMIIPIITEI